MNDLIFFYISLFTFSLNIFYGLKNCLFTDIIRFPKVYLFFLKRLVSTEA